MHTRSLLLALSALATVTGCASGDSGEVTTELTWHKDAKAILDARCATCHRAGDIGPFPLTTYEDVATFAVPVRASIEAGTMPPWQPADDCNSYEGSLDLLPEERATLLAWLEGGHPEGAADPGADEAPTTDARGFDADISLQLPEAYTPAREPDDYRCQLVDWPADETRYVTGVSVTPDQRSIVHHVIVFVVSPDQRDRFVAFDEAEEGPGYTCYGGPTASEGQGGGGLADLDLPAMIAALTEAGYTLADLRAGAVPGSVLAELMGEGGGNVIGGFQTLGSWVPGAPQRPFPAGTGIRVEPGSTLVLQMHYNTLTSAPVADRSSVEIRTAASVEREATNLMAVDLGWVTNGLLGPSMEIPAGASEVAHSTEIAFDSVLVARARQTLGLGADDGLVVHTANHHMHALGRTMRSEIRSPGGQSTCLLDLPDWDFNWQGQYQLTEAVPFGPGDVLWMGCTWDNSEANQPVIDGVVRAPADVSWGEGTSDEMCLGGFYVTGE